MSVGVRADDDERQPPDELLERRLARGSEDDFPDLKALLLAAPEAGEDADFERIREFPRELDFS